MQVSQKKIEQGQLFITIEEGSEVMQTACREYTHSRNLTTSRPRGGSVQIRRSAQSWMWNSILTKAVTALISWSNHCLETEQFHGFALWVVSTNTCRNVRRNTHWEHWSVHQLMEICGKGWAKTETCCGFVFQFSSYQWKIMERRWYTSIRSQLFWSVKIHDQNTATRSVNSSRNWRSSKIRRPDREIEGVKFADTLQWTASTWVNSLVKGGGKKKRFQYCLNPYSSNEILYFRATQGHSNCKTKNCCRMTLPSTSTTSGTPTSAFYYSKWTDPRWKKQQKGQTVSVLHGSEPDGHSTWSKRSWIRYAQTQNRTVQTHLEISSQYSILVQFNACSDKGIALLSNSVACNYSFRHTTSDLYLHENKGRTLLQNIQVSQVTSRSTCAELATRSEGCICFRFEKIRWPWEWSSSAQGNLWQWPLCWFSNPWHSNIPLLNKLNQIEKKKFDE